MRSFGIVGKLAVLLLVLVLAFASCPAAAVDHDSGESWTYESSMTIEVGSFSVNVSGNITYVMEEERSITGQDETVYDVNVISVHGQLSGEAGMFDEPVLEANVVIDGFLFETVGGAAIVREDKDTLVDATMLSGLDQWSIQEETKSVLVFDPPFLDDFDPKTVVLGSGWTVTGTVNKTITSWEDGVSDGPRATTEDATHTVVVGSAIEERLTPAGLFHTVKLVITSPGGYEIRWWSDEVNGYVRIDSYTGTTDDLMLTESIVLVEHVEGSTDSMLWAVLVGVAVAALASIALVAVLMRMKAPKGS